MLEIKFRYRDFYSNFEWREQSCKVSSLEQFEKIYGLDRGDVEYEILSVTEK